MCAVELPSLELRGSDTFQHDNAPVHDVRPIKTLCLMVGEEELEFFSSPAQRLELKPSEHLRDELQHPLCPRPPHPTSISDLTNAIVAEWVNPHHQTLKPSGKSILPRRVEAIITAKGKEI